MQRLYETESSSQGPSSQAAPESSHDALLVQPFGSRTQSDKPGQGMSTLRGAGVLARC